MAGDSCVKKCARLLWTIPVKLFRFLGWVAGGLLEQPALVQLQLQLFLVLEQPYAGAGPFAGGAPAAGCTCAAAAATGAGAGAGEGGGHARRVTFCVPLDTQ